MNADENNQIKLTNNNANDEEPARSRLSSASRVTDINKSGDSNPAFLAAHTNQLYFGGTAVVARAKSCANITIQRDSEEQNRFILLKK